MLMIGFNLLSAADKLQYIEETKVHDMLVNSSPEFSTKMEQLRAIRQIDSKQYTSMKRMLPYLVCGSFNLPYRRLENFACTDCFVLDVDHISEKGLDLESTRKRIQRDERVVLCFVSPGEDGLKVIFHLKEKCYDVELFKLFYKTFAQKFSIDYNLDQAIDSRTCDATRACFMSIDKEAYYNPNAIAVDINNFIEQDNIQSLLDLKHYLRHVENETSTALEPKSSTDPNEQALEAIKQTLSLHKKPVVIEKIVYVPAELEEIIGSVVDTIEKTGIVVADVVNIQYGKKIKVKMGALVGEINLFYGKNGFTVVQSPKRGTSEKLNQITADIINNFIEETDAKNIAFLNEKMLSSKIEIA